MEYRLTKDNLVDALSAWNNFLKRKVHLIACGGTALTLMGVKDSTKDIDFMVPTIGEHDYLISRIKDIGYYPITGWGWQRDGEEYIFDLFRGNKIHTTELLESPLEEKNNFPLFELSHLYVGILNYYDLLISKLFRGDSVDIDDCLMLIKEKTKEIDITRFKRRFLESAKYDNNEEKQKKTLEFFLTMLEKEKLI